MKPDVPITRSTHIASPEPAAVRALLDAAGWSGYEAAKRIGMTNSAFAQVLRGETRLRGPYWQLLLIHATQSARDSLPSPPLSAWPQI